MVEDITSAALLYFRIEELEAESNGLRESIAEKAIAGVEAKNLSKIFSAQLEKLTFLKELWGQMFDGLHARDISTIMDMQILLKENMAELD